MNQKNMTDILKKILTTKHSEVSASKAVQDLRKMQELANSQPGPHDHQTAAIAVALKEAATPKYH